MERLDLIYLTSTAFTQTISAMCLREPISVCRRVESRLARSGSITVWVVVMRVGPGGSQLQMISTLASDAGSRKPVLGFMGRMLTESDSA